MPLMGQMEVWDNQQNISQMTLCQPGFGGWDWKQRRARVWEAQLWVDGRQQQQEDRPRVEESWQVALHTCFHLKWALNVPSRACKLASTESLDDDGYLKNNDQKIVADEEDVDDEGYLRNNDQRMVNPVGNREHLEMTGSSSAGDNGYLYMGGSSRGNHGYQLKMNGNGNEGYLKMSESCTGKNGNHIKMAGNSKQGSLQRAPTALWKIIEDDIYCDLGKE